MFDTNANRSPRNTLPFRKSTYSEGGDCVEVAAAGGLVLMRDSKDPDGPVLRFTPREWDAFVGGVLAGEFDLG
ncbi:DUF397 domain-containing protein [Amycolatopsis minnesotensis]|uniref:DUF397 domain-containing protein n=1 Tax=Amycolatopsis minnesotensis TaxID=337894 RepID=A0ABP5CIR5_9PSEU